MYIHVVFMSVFGSILYDATVVFLRGREGSTAETTARTHVRGAFNHEMTRMASKTGNFC